MLLQRPLSGMDRLWQFGPFKAHGLHTLYPPPKRPSDTLGVTSGGHAEVMWIHVMLTRFRDPSYLLTERWARRSLEGEARKG